MSKPAYSVIKQPLFTEKNAVLSEAGKYVFEVFPGIEKPDVKAAVEAHFKVTVEKVNIVNTKGKIKASRTNRGQLYRESDVKKAIVTLAKGQKIDLA